MKMSPKYYAEALSNEYNRKIETRDVEKAWKKMGLTYLDMNNSPKLTKEGIARGGQVTGTGFAFSFDYDSLKEEVLQQIPPKRH